jgi:trk system potassium uptake protein TrkH
MRLSIVIYVVGRILRILGLTFLAPVVVTLIYGRTDELGGFLVGGAVTSLVSLVMVRASRQAGEDLRRIEALAVVATTWLLVAGAGAIPYVWVGLTPIDAVFESMSGFTTTGATVLVDFGQLGPGMMFWRSMTQWLGGMGVITLFVAVLPRLAIGVRQLFFTEAPGPTQEKLTPHIGETAAYLWRFYAGLTVAALIALMIAGMPLFDALCHSMTTLAAGGFSPHPASIMGYENAAVEWIICVFMFLAGANFALQYRALFGQPGALVRDEEFRLYTTTVVTAAGALALILWVSGTADAVRPALFQTLSILTTTGYASVDFELWADQAKMVLLVLMFIGGCAGSAAGGPKVLRHLLMGRYTMLELRRTLHPRGVLPVKLGRQVVSDKIMRTVLVFFLFYMLVFAVGAAVVIGLGADIVTGFTASIATLGNIGPGFSEVGPLASYGHLHPLSKIVLTLSMWIGRLEVITVLALLRWEVWSGAHWRGIDQRGSKD